jgi:predicted nucleic acid-binding Zn ribbon protein
MRPKPGGRGASFRFRSGLRHAAGYPFAPGYPIGPYAGYDQAPRAREYVTSSQRCAQTRITWVRNSIRPRETVTPRYNHRMPNARCPHCRAPLPPARTCASETCGQVFYRSESGRTDATYCSARCRNAARSRRHRQRNAEQAAA